MTGEKNSAESVNDWASRYDEIDNAPETHITIRREPYKVLKQWLERDRAYYSKSIKGLYFDEVKWRLYRQTHFNTTPLLSRMDEIASKPFYINNTEIGKFRFCIPFGN